MPAGRSISSSNSCRQRSTLPVTGRSELEFRFRVADLRGVKRGIRLRCRSCGRPLGFAVLPRGLDAGLVHRHVLQVLSPLRTGQVSLGLRLGLRRWPVSSGFSVGRRVSPREDFSPGLVAGFDPAVSPASRRAAAAGSIPGCSRGRGGVSAASASVTAIHSPRARCCSSRAGAGVRSVLPWCHDSAGDGPARNSWITGSVKVASPVCAAAVTSLSPARSSAASTASMRA